MNNRVTIFESTVIVQNGVLGILSSMNAFLEFGAQMLNSVTKIGVEEMLVDFGLKSRCGRRVPRLKPLLALCSRKDISHVF